MKNYSIDRIEENIALLIDDDGKKIEIEVQQLPEGIREGDVLKSENGEYLSDEEETKRRKERILSLRNKLFKKK